MVFVLLAAVGAVAILIVAGSSGPARPAPVATAPPGPGPQPQPRPQLPPDVPVRPQLDPVEAELFADSAPPAPRVFIPVLSREGAAPFDLPRFAARAGKGGGEARPGDAKRSLAEIKKATVYVKVGGDAPATGSGFVVTREGNGGLIATNCHVIESAILQVIQNLAAKPPIKVVFDSNLGTEKTADA